MRCTASTCAEHHSWCHSTLVRRAVVVIVRRVGLVRRWGLAAGSSSSSAHENVVGVTAHGVHMSALLELVQVLIGCRIV